MECIFRRAHPIIALLLKSPRADVNAYRMVRQENLRETVKFSSEYE